MQHLSQIFKDLLWLIQSPTGFAKDLQTRIDWRLNKTLLIFILAMNTYYLLLPSLWIFHILILLFMLLALGTMYYFMQEAWILSKEQQDSDMEDDERMYLIAYGFAIANLPALFVNIIVHIVVLSLAANLLIGIFILSFVGFVTFAVAVYYPYRVFKSLVPQASFIEVVVRSFVTACKERVGVNAIQELMLDWQRV